MTTTLSRTAEAAALARLLAIQGPDYEIRGNNVVLAADEDLFRVSWLPDDPDEHPEEMFEDAEEAAGYFLARLRHND